MLPDNPNSKLKYVSTFLSLFFVVGCASYTQENEKIRDLVYQEQFADALEKIDKSDLKTTARNSVLYHLERGTIYYTNNKYKEAAVEFGLATKRMEELYTVSVSSQAASLIVNESYSDYEGEEHERVLATTFAALAYFANNEPEKAIVEARKTNQVLKAINDANAGKSAATRDAFTRYLAGLIYETKFEWDAAIVEYRSALEESKGTKGLPDGVGTAIASSLGRLLEHRGRSELLSQLKTSYPRATWTSFQKMMEMGEVIVVYESGKSPIKVTEDIVLPIAGNVTRISYPRYTNVYYTSHGATVNVDGKSAGRTLEMQDIGELAREALSHRRVKDMVRLTARLIAKDQAARAVGRNFGPFAQLGVSIFGSVLETADTRSWTLLPDTLQILRVPVPAGKDVRIDINPDAGTPKDFVVNLRPGQKTLVRYRTFR